MASVERLEKRQLLSAAATAAVATKLAAEGKVEVDVRASDLPSGPVSAWTNEGAAGGTFLPWTANAPTVGTFTDSNGLAYQAVSFNSSALKSSFNSPDDLNGNSARSIEVWVLNPTIDGGEESMVAWSRRGGNPDGSNVSFTYGANYAVGEWGAEYDMTWPLSAAPGAPITAPPENVWHNLTFTYDGNGTEDVYVDGALQLTGASDGTQSIAALMSVAGFPVDLGAQNDGNGNPAIPGSLDLASVRISNGALTAADVTQNFNAGVPGQSPPLAAPNAAPVMNAPTGTGGVVALSWSYVGDAGTGFGYNVFRSDPAHPTPTAVASNVHALSYIDSAVTNGVAYTYTVVAANSAGSGPSSNSVMATPVATPATPGNFTAGRAGGTSTVFLNWSPSVNAPAGTTYDVKRGTALNADGTVGGTVVDITPGGISGTSAVDSNAAANATYYYAVTASNSGSASAPSPAAKVGPAPAATNTALASAGTVEVDVRAADLPAGQVTNLPNQGAAGGSFVPWTTGAPTAGVVVDANGVSYEALQFKGTALKSTFNTPNDLNDNSARSIEVWALNPSLDAADETLVAWSRRGGNPDGTNMSFSYGSTFAVSEWGAEYDMTWDGSSPGGTGTPPAPNIWHNLTFTYDGNGTEDVYVDGALQLSGASDGTQSIGALMSLAGFPIGLAAQNDGNGNPATLGSLDLASVRIMGGALTADDVTKDFKAGVPGQQVPLAAPTAAPVVGTPAATGGVVALSWSYVGDAGTGFGYNVLRSDPGHPTPVALASNLHALSYIDQTVTTGVTYTYTVVAVNSAGSGPSSNAVTATPVAAPATPTNFTAARAGGTTHVVLNWSPSANAPAGTTYDVKRGTALNADGTLGGTIVDVTPGGITGTSAIDTTAATNATYYYAVTASNAGSASAPSPAAKVGPAPAAAATALAAEGTVEVDVRAVDLPAGPVTSWTNEGTAGGSFVPWTTGAPTVGAFTDSNGVSYQAVNFNSTALKSTFNSPDDLNGNSARSIEVWVLNPTIDGGEESMVSWSRRGGPNGTNESFSYGSNYAVGEWGGAYDMTWTGSALPTSNGMPPAANVWHNLTFTYDGSGTEDVYVDGALQLTGASDGTANIGQLMTAAGFPIGLGAQNDGRGNPAVLTNLDIASVRIMGGALTPDDVTKDFTAGVPGQQAPTTAPAAAPVLATPGTSGGSVQLNWSYVGDAGAGFGYDVFRSDSAHPTPTAVATGVVGLSYTDTAVTGGTQYTYYVVAKNSAGSGPHSNAVTATPTGGQLGPDFNGDGKVNFSDLLILAQHYGKTGVTHAEGDANGDGKVNFSDLLILAQNYGKGGTQPATDSLSKLVDAVRAKRRR